MANKNFKNYPVERPTPREEKSAAEIAKMTTPKSTSTETLQPEAPQRPSLEDAITPATPVEEKSAANPVYWIPYGVKTFAELEMYEESREAAFEIAEKSNLFPQLIENIMMDDDIADKSAAVEFVSKEFAVFVANKTQDVTKEKSLFGRIADKVTEALTPKTNTIQKDKHGSLLIWKQDDTYRFLATYSNNYRDIETEIISEKSHERYVELVDKGEFPLPVLRHFHIPGSEWGQAEMVHYDKDTGFALAAGYILPGHEAEAEAIMLRDDIAMSHGMVKESVKRDANDNLVIIEHQTVEVSDLPFEDAANKLTNFHIIKEVEDMKTLPQNKKEYLASVGVNSDALSDLEKSLQAGKVLAADLQLDSKQDGDDPAPVEPVTAPVVETPAPVATPPVVEAPVVEVPVVEVETPVVEAPPTEEAPVTPAAPAVEEVPTKPAESAFDEKQTAELMGAFKAMTDGIVESVSKQIDARLAPLVEAKSESDKATEQIMNMSPMASLQDIIINKEYLKEQSAIGQEETLVDGRTILGKDAPTETQSGEENLLDTGNTLLDMLGTDLITGRQLAELREPA